MTHSFTQAPTLEEIEEIAQHVFDTIPEDLKRRCLDLVIRIADFPDAGVEADMALESPFDLLGLYQGVSLEHRQNPQSGLLPDMIFLYRRPILDYWCDSGEALSDLIRHVMIHEIGHHFGFSDADMERLEAESDNI